MIERAQINTVNDPQIEIIDSHMHWIIKPQFNIKTNTSKGGLAISNILYFENRQKINEDNISAVLSVCGDKYTMPVEFPQQVQRFCIDVGDHPTENISSFFNSTYDFIQKNIKKGNVIVHCRAGISRSSSFVIAYLIKKNSYSYQQAYQLVKSQRNIIQPNKGFQKQLKQYAKKTKNQKNFLLFGPFKWCMSS